MQKYKLKDISKIVSGATPLTKKAEFYNGDISWITPKDLSGYNHKYIYSGSRMITKEGYNSCATTLLPKGSVLFSSRAPIGYVAIAGKELCTNQGFKSFICNEKIISNQYLYYYLKYNTKIFEKLGNGSTFKEISLTTLSNYEIEIPSVEEQNKIIKELVLLDEKYENNCSLLSQLEDFIELTYIKYFERNDFTYINTHLSNLIDIITGGTPSTQNETYWKNGIYNWYTPTDITSCKTIVSNKSEKKISILGLANSGAKLIPANSILMTSRATIGQSIINNFEATTNQGILGLIPKDENISILHLFFWIKRNVNLISSISNGSTFKELYKKDFEKLSININYDLEINFKKDVESVYNLYKSVNTENQLISELKNKILEKIFS